MGENKKMSLDKIKKRKVGRPKKRGPKKKRKSRAKPKPKVRKPGLQWDWRIIKVRDGKQIRTQKYKAFHDIKAAFEKMGELKKENEKIIFESLYKNAYTIKNRKDEYLLIERVKNGEPTSVLKNDLGLFVEHVSTNSEWKIIDKIPMRKEETFWVYGYNSLSQRKTFCWIFENLIVNKLNTITDIVRIILLKNKLILKYDDQSLNIIVCKNQNDSIRFYNLLESFVSNLSLKKYVILCGNFDKNSPQRNQLIDEIEKLTGWKKRRILLNTTRS